MSEWFFIRQKEGKMIQTLKEERKIKVKWELEDPLKDLPSEVVLPPEIFHEVLTTQHLQHVVLNFLSNKFGCTVSSWKIAESKSYHD